MSYFLNSDDWTFEYEKLPGYIFENIGERIGYLFTGVAPEIPFYLTLARTNFVSPKALLELRQDLERVFEKICITAGSSEEHTCGYACSAIRNGETTWFEVCIFRSETSHIVELRRMQGCRVAFGTVADEIVDELGIKFTNGLRAMAPPLVPPALPENV